LLDPDARDCRFQVREASLRFHQLLPSTFLQGKPDLFWGLRAAIHVLLKDRFRLYFVSFKLLELLLEPLFAGQSILNLKRDQRFLLLELRLERLLTTQPCRYVASWEVLRGLLGRGSLCDVLLLLLEGVLMLEA
jgi:hypothetical protein